MSDRPENNENLVEPEAPVVEVGVLLRLERLRAQAEGTSVIKNAAFTIAVFDALPALIEAVKAAQRLDAHIELNGGCHLDCPEHDDFRAALAPFTSTLAAPQPPSSESCGSVGGSEAPQ